MSDDARALLPWLDAVGRELGIEVSGEAIVDAVLDMTSDVAHGVSRPAAPVTAFLIGVAAGRASDPQQAAEEYAERIAALARTWPHPPRSHPPR